MQIRSPRESALRSHILGHGGNLESARALNPRAPEPWIDLSTGINPAPYPVGEIPAEAFARLPGRSELAALVAAARSAYDVASADALVAAPGTQALIQVLPRLRPAARVAVVGPTYSEHARAWSAGGATVETVASPDLAAGADTVVIVNPNNPDGRIHAPDVLREAAERCVARGGLLVVDEAFVDVTPGVSILPAGLPPATVVLRSFGKTYGLGGLRLGFAVADPTLAEEIEAALGPWAVSGPALVVGARALADSEWLAAATRRLVRDATRLDALLAAAGMTVIGGTPLFRLAETADAGAVFDRLAAAGILVRPFDYAPNWLRFGIPGSAADFARLAEALGAPHLAEHSPQGAG